MTVEISRAALRAMLAHAAQSPDREICGLLLGALGRIETVQSAENIAAQPESGFELDPRALLAAIREAREGGPEVVGHYHSHPRGYAEPSVRDRANAFDIGQIWVIIANGEARAWRVVAAGRLAAVELALATDSAYRQ